MSNMSGKANGRRRVRSLGDLERGALSRLAALERPTVKAEDLSTVIPVRTAANLMLSRLARKGWLRRLRRGVYALIPLSSESFQPAIDNPFALATDLFSPCYITGWSAAHHWGLTDQLFNSVVVYTANARQSGVQSYGGVDYLLRRVRTEMIFGTVRTWSGSVPIELASIHRTVIDVLDVPAMGGSGRETLDIVRAYWSKPDADPKELLALAKRLGKGTVFKRLGYTAELFGNPEAAWIEACQRHLSAGVSLLDPAGPARGRIISRWKLRINIPTGPAV
jgi:predicted transcriptional regulator of viral defense system